MKKITEYDIEKIYSDMEKYLINNIIRNLTSDMHSFHLKEEEELGFKWEAWQTAKLRDLQKFRRQNKDIVNSRTKGINKKIAALLNKEAMQGKKTAYKEYKEALTHGYNSSVQVKDSFFKMSSRKVRKLIGSVTNDFQKVNQATFRRSNDIYRQIIVEASMYKNTGVMTSKQAINKAIEDFKSRGINSIVYSNGSKHKISDYASMAIRTASTRAQLMGEGELRKKMGVSTIQMSKHSTSCKLCQPWEGKVLIDDVYSGGSKKDGNYPLLSDAMKQGLYHPNCRHGHGTYFPELHEEKNIIRTKNKKYPDSIKNKKIYKEEISYIGEDLKLGTIKVENDSRILKGYNIETKQKLHKLEKEKKPLNHEVGTIMDRDGNILETIIGQEHTLGKLTKEQTRKLKDNILTHNHPSGGCFSEGDIIRYIEDDVYELRASTPKGFTYSLRKGENIVDKVGFIKQYIDDRPIDYDIIEKEMYKLGKQGKLEHLRTTEDMLYVRHNIQNELMDKWLKENSSKYGLVYSKEKTK